jgi:hypothetical protein
MDIIYITKQKQKLMMVAMIKRRKVPSLVVFCQKNYLMLKEKLGL